MTQQTDHAAAARRLMPSTGEGLAPNRIALAQVHATLALVEQQRIANRLKVAELDLVEELGAAPAGENTLNFRIRWYLTTDDWKSIEVPEDDEVFS